MRHDPTQKEMSPSTKIRFYVRGLSGSQLYAHGTVGAFTGIPPAEWADMDEDEQTKALDEAHSDWLEGCVKSGWEIVKKGDKTP